ncbi:MAG: DoxX family membrane protein, partial [Deltaproteobacteria bacterium]|nr:DoxX family membrane protein [Deltaproteobacteria bacterium]
FNLYNDNQIPLVHGWGVKSDVPAISLERALEIYQKKEAVFIDSRKSAFYEQRHIKGADNLPLLFFDLQFPLFQFMLTERQVGKDKPIIVYGGSFSRRFDYELAHLLKEKEYSRVMVLAGNPEAWQKKFPVAEQPGKTPAAMPLGIPGYLEWIPVGIFLLILIPPVRRSPYLSAFCRVLLGVIFIQFALSKIMRPAVFALNVVDYALMPAWGVNLWALVLPWAELVVGLFLILGIRTRAAATIIGGMNIIFIVGLVNAIFLNLPINCGCVGEVGEPVNWWKVLKNTGMLLMTVQIFLYDRLFVLDRGGFIWRERTI